MLKSPIPVKDEALGTRELVLTLNKRLASAAIASALAAVAMSVVVVSLFPLKEVRPYIIEVGKDGSAYVPPQSDAVAYNPTFETVSFFLRRWVSDAYTINAHSTVQVLDPRARLFLRGSIAIGAYGDFLKGDRKFEMMAEDPALARDVEIMSSTPIAGVKNGVVLHTKLITRRGGVAREDRRLVTIYYEFFKPADRRDAEGNPIGIFVTDFKIGVGNE